MSAVETIRDIPVIVEHMGCKSRDVEPMDLDHDYTSGFPFDNSGRRTRDPLEEIAQRHPEFAQHLQSFPRRTQRSGGDQDEDEFLRRRFERPFSSGRFERFGFPFDRDDFEREPQRYYEAYPEYFENFQNRYPQSPPNNHPQSPQHRQSSTQSPQGYQQYPPQYGQQYQPQYSQSQENQSSSQSPPQYQSQQSQSVSQGTQTDESQSEQIPHHTENQSQEYKAEGGQIRGRPIQQSNTCDLAQHQPPDEALNERGQRSMSAPPENKRFTSSVNIPMGGHQESNASSIGSSKSQTSSGSTERVIPIHVEGRDDPVIPKNVSGSYSQPPHHQQPQPERIFSESPRAQPESIFGRRPEAFTQFVHRDPHRFPNDWPHSFGSFPEDEFGFRQTESPTRFTGTKPHMAHQQQQQPHKQETAPQTHAPKPQPQEPKAPSQSDATQQPHKQPQPPKQPLGPIDQIQAIQKDVSSLLRQVEAFAGIPKDKNYLYLDEMLTRNLLKLDNIDTQGQDAIRSARKEAIRCIEKAIGLLEAKAAANVASKEEKMEVEHPQDGTENMETERSTNQEPSAMEMSPPTNPQNEVMEVAPDTQGNKSTDGKTTEQQPKSEDDMAKAENLAAKEEKEMSSEGKSTESKTTELQPNDEKSGGISGEHTDKNVNNEEPKKEEEALEKSKIEESSKDHQAEEPTVEQQTVDETAKAHSGEEPANEASKVGKQVKTEGIDGEKKEKKKIKKKVNKENKDNKQ